MHTTDFFFFGWKGQDEEEEIHQIMMQLDKDHKGTLGQRIFSQRSAVLRGNAMAFAISSC